MPVPKPKSIVFTDLDGCLLDHHSYSWADAAPLLTQLLAEHVPVVFNSSKTPSEIEFLQQQIGLKQPYIAENGGACCTPDGQCRLAENALSYTQIRAILTEIRNHDGIAFTGFGDQDSRAVARDTGLQPDDARRACQRMASEPLQIAANEEHVLLHKLLRNKLTAKRGGRYFTVSGHHDKSSCMQQIVEGFAQQWQCPASMIHTIAIGDSPNDLPMLEAADQAIVIPSPQGVRIHPDNPNLTLAPQPGPAGWAAALQHVMQNMKDHNHD